MKKVDLYTDGACSGNPGIGGWAAILIYKGISKQFTGGEKLTTNNRMELLAIVKGLKMLNQSCEVRVFSDSAYCVNAINNKWIDNWQANNWQTANKEQVKNQDLWKELLSEMKKHKVSFVKVKGHSDNEYNNLCDQLAKEEIAKIQKENI